ncbi:MAG: metallothionein [Actinomycetota bacterium]
MKCGHEGCTCEVAQDQEFCSDHCREHVGEPAHGTHGCGCGHPGCGGA